MGEGNRPEAVSFCNSPGIFQEIRDVTNSEAKVVKEIPALLPCWPHGAAPEIRRSEFLLLAPASWTNPLNISSHLSSVRAGLFVCFYKLGHKSITIISQLSRKPNLCTPLYTKRSGHHA